MCGVVGAFPLNKPGLEIDPQTRRLVLLYLHNEILFETVARGKDATGMALSFGAKEEGGNPYWAVLKQPVRTAEFFTNDGTSARYKGQDEEANIERYMDVACLLNRDLKHVLGHTRAKTKGSEFNPLNNHPILVGNIIGIHNGGVKNDDIIYKKYPEMTPLGEVDSEAIIQLLAMNAPDRALGLGDIKFVTERIEGPRAVMAYNRNHPDKVIYFHDKDRPLELAYIYELGLAVLCSEKRFFEAAMSLYERARLTLKRDLPELSYSWRKIPDGYGGVIDVSAEVDDTQDVEKMFPLVECEKTLFEFETVKSYSGNKTYHPPKTGYGATTTGSKTGTSGSTGSKTGTSGGSFSGDQKLLGPGEKPHEADIIDYSKFGAEGAGQTQHVDASLVIDDNDDDDEVEEDETIDDRSGCVADELEDDELRNIGISYVLSEAAKDDEELMINFHEGNFKALFGKLELEEGVAAEAVAQLYPEMFGEGFARGYRSGAEKQLAVDEEESEPIIEAVQKLDAETEELKKLLESERSKLRRAANVIANTKAFLMAAMVTHQLAEVENGKLVFNEDLEDFLQTAEGFENADLGRVKGLFGKKDLQVLSDGFYAFAQEVMEDEEETVDSHTVKNITK